jgi:hypothetical protein
MMQGYEKVIDKSPDLRSAGGYGESPYLRNRLRDAIGSSLDQLLKYGVTTALDMGCWPAVRVNALRNLPGHTDNRSVGDPATSNHRDLSTTVEFQVFL